MTIEIKKILCPVDFSKSSDLAIVYANDIAQKLDADLTLLHVVTPPMPILPGDVGMLATPTFDVNEVAETCQSRLQQITAEIENPVDMRFKVLSGVPFVEIVRYAREHSFDMIVMGSHGRSALGHMLMGSVAERVVRKAPCPVLTVKDRCGGDNAI